MSGSMKIMIGVLTGVLFFQTIWLFSHVVPPCKNTIATSTCVCNSSCNTTLPILPALIRHDFQQHSLTIEQETLRNTLAKDFFSVNPIQPVCANLTHTLYLKHYDDTGIANEHEKTLWYNYSCDFILDDVNKLAFARAVSTPPELLSSYEPFRTAKINKSFDEFAYAAATKDTTDFPGVGYVIYTTFTGDYHLYLSNWLVYLNFHKRVPHVIPIGSRREDCELLWSHDLPCFAHEDLVDFETPHSIQPDARAFTVMSPVALKWYYGLRLLQLGLKPLFSDGDVIFMQDPFLLVNTDFDMQGLSDFLTVLHPNNGIPVEECPMYSQRKEPCQSTGIMYFENTIATHAFLWNMWEKVLLSDGKFHLEQPIANYELPKFLNLLRYRLFTDDTAANCAIARRHGRYFGWRKTVEKLIALHVGYLGGFRKAEAYHTIHLWNADENYRKHLNVLPSTLTKISELIPHDMPVDFCLLRDGLSVYTAL